MIGASAFEGLMPIDVYVGGKREFSFRWPAAPRAGDLLDLDGRGYIVVSVTWEQRTGTRPPVWIRVDVRPSQATLDIRQARGRRATMPR